MAEAPKPIAEDLTPYPSQAEADEMMKAAIRAPLGQPRIAAREGDDLTPTPTQAQLDAANLIAIGPAPESLPPVNKDVPMVSGPSGLSAAVGDTLNCTMGNWTGEPSSYVYQWKRGATAVGTNSNNYTAVAADAGASVTCVVTAANANGSTMAPPSNAIVIAAAARAAR